MTPEAYILVVDDDEVIIRIISNILIRNNYQTDSCHSGEEAIIKITQNTYDLVLLDVQMGRGLNGYETCRLMQKSHPDLPVILVTANQDDESVNRGFESGSSDYIKKPVSRLELLARVNKTITLKRTEKKNLQLIEDLRKDLYTAANIQQAMLPKWVYIDGDLLFSSYYEASEAVGGDLFDRIELDKNRYVVYIGDVSGHGVQAALLMSAIKSSIKLMVEAEKDTASLAQLFTKLNERLYNDLFIRNNYLTLLMGVIDLELKEFRYLNAGHPPIIIIDTITKEITIRDEKGSLPLGWMNNTTYEEEDIDHFPLKSTDIFLLFTDGIYECVNPQNKQFGMDGLKDTIHNDLEIDSCITLPYKIKDFLTKKGYGTTSDDFTLFSFQTHNEEKVKVNKELSVKSLVKHYLFVLRSALKEVGKTSQECEKLVLDWTDNAVLAAKVELIVDEFLNNIVKYGYNYLEDSVVVIEFKIHDSKLAIRFWDKGIEWVPDKMPYNFTDPFDFEHDVMNTSGKGVKMIMSMSNRFIRTRFDQLNETKIEIDL